MVKYKYMQFFMKNLKMKEKKDIFFDFLEQGFEPQIFSNFPAHDLNFNGREGDEIKSKQVSKRDRTLSYSFTHKQTNMMKHFIQQNYEY